MTELEDLARRADEYADEGNFAAARDLYRQIAMSAAPTRQVLDNLAVEEESERLQFLRTLADEYPGSADVRLRLASALSKVGNNEQAITQYTMLIEDPNMPNHHRLYARWGRLRAVVSRQPPAAGKLYGTFAEDFAYLWRLGDLHDWALQSRDDLLRELASIASPGAIPALEHLVGEEWLPTAPRDLIVAKVYELRFLAKVLEAQVYDETSDC